MGSKAKYKKYIVPILQKTIDDNNVTLYQECFVGGANIIDSIKCERRIGYDRSDTLIALLCQMRDDFSKVLKYGSRDLWDKGKAYVKEGKMPKDMTLAEIGAMEFFGSFSNGGFPRGYAKKSATRDYYNEAYRNAEKQAPLLRGIEFYTQNYWDLEPCENAVIYLDPPYQGTKQYGYANQPTMDYEFFWNWVRELSKTNYVFVSEQTAPDDFASIWTQKVKRTAGKDNNFKAVEHLYIYKEGMSYQYAANC